MNIFEETWRTVPDFPAYQCSDRGRVRRVKPQPDGTISYLRIKQTVAQYKQVQLSQNGKRKYYYTHRLVLEVFRPDCNAHKKTVHFLDGNTLNCFLSNLAWTLDRRKKLDYKTAEEIRKLRRETTLTYEDLADRYDVTSTTIGEICRNESWKRP
jgi:DNA-binding XRE family transcriptional regulator